MPQSVLLLFLLVDGEYPLLLVSNKNSYVDTHFDKNFPEWVNANVCC